MSEGREAWLYIDKWSKPEYVDVRMTEPQQLAATVVEKGIFLTLPELDDVRNDTLEEAANAALKGMNPDDAAVRIRAMKR